MFLILFIVLLSGLKFFAVSIMDNVSWWWIVGLFLFTFVYFEFFERVLGLDKKKAHKVYEEIHKLRTKKLFSKRK